MASSIVTQFTERPRILRTDGIKSIPPSGRCSRPWEHVAASASVTRDLEETDSCRDFRRKKLIDPPCIHFVVLHLCETAGAGAGPYNGLAFFTVARTTAQIRCRCAVDSSSLNSRMPCCKGLIAHPREHSSDGAVLHVCKREENHVSTEASRDTSGSGIERLRFAQDRSEGIDLLQNKPLACGIMKDSRT